MATSRVSCSGLSSLRIGSEGRIRETSLPARSFSGEEDRTVAGHLPHPGEEEPEIGEVVVELVHVGALAAALAVPAAVEEVDPVARRGERAGDLAVSAE